MSAYQHVLCAVDLGAENRLVAARAVELARQNSAKLTLLHVVEYIPIDLANELVLPQQQEIEQQLADRSRDVLAGLVEVLGCGDAAQVVTTGSTKAEIIEQSKLHNADLIVIGRHGRHGISRLLGSTANAVLHHAACDVLAVHIPA